MEILHLKMGDSKKNNGVFVRMTPDEALLLIGSLASQMVHHDPNGQRQEFYAKDGIYFTIAVHDHLSSDKES